MAVRDVHNDIPHGFSSLDDFMRLGDRLERQVARNPLDRRSQGFLCGRSSTDARRKELLPGLRPLRRPCGVKPMREDPSNQETTPHALVNFARRLMVNLGSPLTSSGR